MSKEFQQVSERAGAESDDAAAATWYEFERSTAASSRFRLPREGLADILPRLDLAEEPSADLTHTNISQQKGTTEMQVWEIERGADGKIIRAVSKLKDEQDSSLVLARTRLLQQVESSIADPEKKLEILRGMKSLEDSFRKTTNDKLRAFPMTLCARYEHVRSVLQQSSHSSGTAIAELNRPLNPMERTMDVSGTYTPNLDKTEIADPPTPLAKQSRRAILESELRKPEIWQTQSTELPSEQGTKTSAKVITLTRNGQRIEAWSLSESNGETTLRSIIRGEDLDGLAESRDRFMKSLIKSGLPAEAQLEVLRDMAQLEQRMRSGELGGRTMPEARVEISKVYNQIGRILTHRNPNTEYKVPVVRQLMRELADPSDIDQGPASDACRVVTAQVRLATRSPSVIAKIVADGLLESKVCFTAPDGKKQEVFMWQENREPSSPKAIEFPRPAGARSLASQIYQISVMHALGSQPDIVADHVRYAKQFNLMHQGADLIEGPLDRLYFHQGKETGTENENNGMTVYGRYKDGPLRPVTGGKRGDGETNLLLQARSAQKVLDLFEPGKHSGAFLCHSEMVKYTRSRPDGSPDNANTVLFKNEEELKQRVIEAKRNGNMPLIVASIDSTIDGLDRASSIANMFNSLRVSDNSHIMIIRDYVPANGNQPEYLITDDFFGKQYDRRVLPREEWSTYFMKWETAVIPRNGTNPPRHYFAPREPK